jgi:hypothetical protein
MKRISGMIVCVLVSGCFALSPGLYPVSVNNNQVLKQFYGKKVMLTKLELAVPYDSMCRAFGPIQFKEELTIAQFIQQAFNDEFKVANIFSEEGIHLTGTVDKITFSSVKGWWDIAITLHSTNGRTVHAENRYHFGRGFFDPTVCYLAARDFGPSVQALIHKTITDPEFGLLLE